MLALLLTGTLLGGTVTIPDSALIPTSQLYTNDYGNIVVMTGGGNAPGVGDPSGRNDDGFSGPINLGFTLDYFGTDYTQFYVNNNGNISFGGGISAYTPSGLTGANAPVISPFFSDVDTRNSASGVVMLNTSIANEIIVTWPGVGYYNNQADLLDTFQLILRGPGYSVPPGEGQIGFFWTTMQWEVGGASGGSGGFCQGTTYQDGACSPAAVGFGDGLGNSQVLQNSTVPGVSALVNDESIWFNLTNGVPTTVHEPGTWALLASGLAGVLFWRRRK